jgi:hypothetical protein
MAHGRTYPLPRHCLARAVPRNERGSDRPGLECSRTCMAASCSESNTEPPAQRTQEDPDDQQRRDDLSAFGVKRRGYKSAVLPGN